MSRELEDRLERVADTLPAPTADSRDRARSAALAVLPEAPQRRRRRLLLLVPAIALRRSSGRPSRSWPHRGATARWRPSGRWPRSATSRSFTRSSSSRGLAGPSSTSSPGASGRRKALARSTGTTTSATPCAFASRLGGGPLPGGEYLHTPEGFFTDLGVRRGQPPPQPRSGARKLRERLPRGTRERRSDRRRRGDRRWARCGHPAFLPAGRWFRRAGFPGGGGRRGRLPTASFSLLLADCGAQDDSMVSGAPHRRDRDDSARSR